MVENFGNGALAFNSTCWVQNKAHGNGLVAAYSAELPQVSNDFGYDNEVVYLAALECEFVALVDGNDQTFPNIACADFEAETCALATEGPTTAPSEMTQETVIPTAATSTDPPSPTAAGGAAEPTVAPTSSTFAIRLVPIVSVSVVSLIAMMMA
jgi:hypothetical protein